jgi:hypothetical protein
MEVGVRNVLEAPGDAGLVVADFRAAQMPHEDAQVADGRL